MEYARVIFCHQGGQLVEVLGIEFDFIFLCPDLLKYYLQVSYFAIEDYFLTLSLFDGNPCILWAPENHQNPISLLSHGLVSQALQTASYDDRGVVKEKKALFLEYQ